MKTRFFSMGLLVGIVLSSIGIYLFAQRTIKNIDTKLFEVEYEAYKQNQDIQFLLQLVQNHSFHWEDFQNVKDTNNILYIYINADGTNQLSSNYCIFSFDSTGGLKKAAVADTIW